MSSLEGPNRQPQKEREGSGPLYPHYFRLQTNLCRRRDKPNNPHGARGTPKCPECRRKKQKVFSPKSIGKTNEFSAYMWIKMDLVIRVAGPDANVERKS